MRTILLVLAGSVVVWFSVVYHIAGELDRRPDSIAGTWARE